MALLTSANKHPQPRRTLLGLLRIVVIAGAVTAALVVALILPLKLKSAYDYHFGFDRQRWLAAGELLHGGKEGGLANPRESMIQDVLAHYLKPNMTRMQVLALLGPADSFGEARLPDSLATPNGLQNIKVISEWASLHSQSDSLLEYGVGWGLIDPTSLSIQFDRNERVINYWVHEH